MQLRNLVESNNAILFNYRCRLPPITLPKDGSLLWNTDDFYTVAFEHFTCNSFSVTRRTSAFQVCSTNTYNFCDIQRIFSTVDMKSGHVLFRFRRNYSQFAVEDFCSTAFELFAGSRCRHTAELFWTNWNKNIFFLQTFN